MPTAFEPFGLLHAIVIAISIVLWWGVVRWAGVAVGGSHETAWRRGFALLVWIPNVLWFVRLWQPENFSWGYSLPLQLCDLAWMAAGWSLWCGGDPQRLRHQVPVLWGFALSLLGYATPAVTSGPGGIYFWSFWTTHWQILAVALVNVSVRGTRADSRGLRGTLLISLVACVIVTAVNLRLGTSYFFTGESKPDNPSPLDLLGPWPLRIVWIVMLGSLAISGVAFAFRGRGPRGGATG